MVVRKKPYAKRTATLLAFVGVATLTSASIPRLSAEKPLIRNINLTISGKTYPIATTAKTLGEAIRQAGYTINQDDKIFPDIDTAVTEGMSARLMRVTHQTVTVNEVIEPNLVRKQTDIMRPGFSKISQPGQKGLRKATYKLTYVDGNRTMKQLLSSEVVKPAVPMIVLYGKGSALPSRGFYSRKVMTMSASAYDPGPRSCGKHANGITSTGMKAGKGVVAVDPRVIRLGSKLYIEGYGFAVAGDVGSAIKGRKIDLGYNSYRSAIQFGRRNVVVHVLE